MESESETERICRSMEQQGYELRETHASVVFLGKDTVYKIKKPVDFGFLDFSTLEARRADCEAEVRLNRRLAEDIYRGVVGICRSEGEKFRIVRPAANGESPTEAAARVTGGSGSPVVEWAVEMRRLDDRDSAERRLHEGRLSVSQVLEIGSRLAEFHEQAECDDKTTALGELAVIEEHVRGNFEPLRKNGAKELDPDVLARVEAFQLDFLARHRARFEERMRRGRIRDGHGDLRLEHCYFDDSGHLDIIDCIEFSEQFRFGDVASDLAFLAMDIEQHQRSDFAEALLASYVQASNDHHLYGVVDFYMTYRAMVRAKVSVLLARDETATEAHRAEALDRAKASLSLADALRPPRHEPTMVAVGGGIASGKSTVSKAWGERRRWPVISADRVRKELLGVNQFTPIRSDAFAGSYDAETSRRVYEELRRRAEVIVESGRSVVIDASFRSRPERESTRRLAERLGVRFYQVECVVDDVTQRERLRARAESPSVSDGRLEILDELQASHEPMDEVPDAMLVRLDTALDLRANLLELERRLAPR